MKRIGGCATYIGTTREVNQDAILFRTTESHGDAFVILAVCDGIGGLADGEVVSALVVDKLNEWYDSVIKWMDIRTIDSNVLYAHLKDVAEEANFAVCEYCESRNVKAGTTMSLLMIIREEYFIIQVGDSRVYSFQNNELQQLTEDACVARIKNGRTKQYLNNYLGKSQELWFTSVLGNIGEQDLFLVCSDGLYHHLQTSDVEEAMKVISKTKNPEEACSYLINRVMERGERDNISAGIVKVKKERKLFGR